MKSLPTMKIEQLKLPEPGRVAEVENAPEGYAAVVRRISVKRYRLELLKTRPDKK